MKSFAPICGSDFSSIDNDSSIMESENDDIFIQEITDVENCHEYEKLSANGINLNEQSIKKRMCTQKQKKRKSAMINRSKTIYKKEKQDGKASTKRRSLPERKGHKNPDSEVMETEF